MPGAAQQVVVASDFRRAFQSLKRALHGINALLGFLAVLTLLPTLGAFLEVLLQLITQKFKSNLGLVLEDAPLGLAGLARDRLGRACKCLWLRLGRGLEAGAVGSLLGGAAVRSSPAFRRSRAASAATAPSWPVRLPCASGRKPRWYNCQARQAFAQRGFHRQPDHTGSLWHAESVRQVLKRHSEAA